jgi:DNA modification methylase
MQIEDLSPAPYNATIRRIEPDAEAGLRHSIEKHGDISGITFNQRTGNLVCGHQRLEQLTAMGGKLDGDAVVLPDGERFPVRVVDWTLAHEMEANLAANNKHIAGGFAVDDPAAAAHVDAVLGGLPDAEQALSGLKALRADFAVEEKSVETEVEEDEVPEPPAEPVTKPGYVWELGDQRLICGDSRFVEHGQRPDMVLTDPPYGVAYVGKTDEAKTIQNDALSPEDLADLVRDVFGAAYAAARPGSYFYATVPAGPPHLIFAQSWQDFGLLRQILVWVKDSMVLGYSEYHYRHEPILFGWKPGGERHKNADRTRTSVLEVPRPKASREHPTMKPPQLWSLLVRDGSREGELVFDPFAGSGTTAVVCEQMGRRSLNIEIDPSYCDVIVERWENLTGGKAKRIAS